MRAYLGIDIGAVTTKLVVLDDKNRLVADVYLGTEGKPVAMVQRGLSELRQKLPPDTEIMGVATTGSARYLAGVLVNADLVKNEITCHAVAGLHYYPQAQTIIDIGGQDSKIIIIRDGLVSDFALNTVCAAGTGSFLDHQAQRLNMSIEEFSRRALESKKSVHISGKCTVFAESDMISKQQMGHKVENIIYGLCQALVRNYLSDVGSGKTLNTPVLFQGGVAFNQGIVRALEEALETRVIVPPHHEQMGAIGAALLVHEEIEKTGLGTRFRGFNISECKYQVASFECKACPNLCEIARLSVEGRAITWGGRCNLWEEPVNQGRKKVDDNSC